MIALGGGEWLGKALDPPYSSIKLRAFSKKDGVPSTSSKASKTGLPITEDFTGGPSFTAKDVRKISNISMK